MSIGLIAACMATLLVLTVVAALWRCSHQRMRYRRCAERRARAGLCRQPPLHH